MARKVSGWFPKLVAATRGSLVSGACKRWMAISLTLGRSPRRWPVGVIPRASAKTRLPECSVGVAPRGMGLTGESVEERPTFELPEVGEADAGMKCDGL